MRHLRSALAAFTFCAAAATAGPQPTPADAEGDAWLKVAALTSGAGAPVVFSEAELNALLLSEPASSWLDEHVGLSRLRVGLQPGRAHFTGALSAARVSAALGPFAAPPGTGDPPVDATVRFGGEGGEARGTILRGSVSGMELPPSLIGELLVELLAGLFPSSGEAEEAIRAGAPFSLPYGLDRVEIASGEVRLLPALRP